MEAIDRLHTTADSHHRVLIVEVMGRHAGWIAFHAGLAGGANVILIPEQPFDVERVCELVGRRFESRFAPIVVVAEGAQPIGGMPEPADGDELDAFGHVRLGGIAHWLEGEIERRTGKETRATVLGHVQRGGTPTAFDRVLATRFGLHAIDAADAGQLGQDDGAARDRDRAGRAERGDGGAEDGAAEPCTRRPRSSLARSGRAAAPPKTSGRRPLLRVLGRHRSSRWPAAERREGGGATDAARHRLCRCAALRGGEGRAGGAARRGPGRCGCGSPVSQPVPRARRQALDLAAVGANARRAVEDSSVGRLPRARRPRRSASPSRSSTRPASPDRQQLGSATAMASGLDLLAMLASDRRGRPARSRCCGGARGPRPPCLQQVAAAPRRCPGA